MSAEAADNTEEVDRAARANLNVVDLARYDDYKKRLQADGSDRASTARGLERLYCNQHKSGRRGRGRLIATARTDRHASYL